MAFALYPVSTFVVYHATDRRTEMDESYETRICTMYMAFGCSRWAHAIGISMLRVGHDMQTDGYLCTPSARLCASSSETYLF